MSCPGQRPGCRCANDLRPVYPWYAMLPFLVFYVKPTGWSPSKTFLRHQREAEAEEAPCVIPGVGTDRGRDGRVHVFDCGKVLDSTNNRCDADKPCDTGVCGGNRPNVDGDA